MAWCLRLSKSLVNSFVSTTADGVEGTVFEETDDESWQLASPTTMSRMHLKRNI